MNTTSISTLLDATRINGFIATPGGRLVAQVSGLNAKGDGYRTRLAEYLDGARTDGDAAVLELTRGSASVGSVALAEDGTTFFTAKRESENGESSDDAQLWALPPRGEARQIATRPGGFGTLRLGDGVLVADLAVHSQATNETEHVELSSCRKKAKVTGALHSAFPTRFWDHDLGPASTVLAIAELPQDLFRAEATPAPEALAGASSDTSSEDAATSEVVSAEDAAHDAAGDPHAEAQPTATQVVHFRYLQMPEGRLLEWTMNREGTVALALMNDTWDDRVGESRLYQLDLRGNGAPKLLSETTSDGLSESPGSFSPDGTRAAVGITQGWTLHKTLHPRQQLLNLTTGERTDLWPEFDYWFSPLWLDDQTLVATTDDAGRGSVWIGSADAAAPRRLAGGPDQQLSFSSLVVADGQLVAIASGIGVAPHPVHIDPSSGEVRALPNPADELPMPGTLTELTAHGDDGTEVRAWLRLPEGDGPHPLVVFAHGGPWGSWNAWTYRWNPNPFVEAGYAVLLPDPAISTGYGQKMIQRGQHELGGAPYTDIMALVDATVARPDIDESRTAFSGGSYGGYMANWVAGHTGDRFRCIVTHASLWDTESMGRTTDNGAWEPPMREQNKTFNPAKFVRDIQVPMLVIHGDKDYRVPIAQGHALWYDLNAFSATPKDANGRTQHRYLYFPDEGHWIMGRGNAEVWYETFIAFLDQHVMGKDWERPATLG